MKNLLLLVILFTSSSSFAQVIHKTPVAKFSNGNFVGAYLSNRSLAVYNSKKEKISESVSASLSEAYDSQAATHRQVLVNERAYLVLEAGGGFSRGKLHTIHQDGSIQTMDLGKSSPLSMVAVSDRSVLIAHHTGLIQLVDFIQQKIVKSVTLSGWTDLLQNSKGQVFAVTSDKHSSLTEIGDPQNLDQLETVPFSANGRFSQPMRFLNDSFVINLSRTVVWFSSLNQIRSHTVAGSYIPQMTAILKDDRILYTTNHSDIVVIDAQGNATASELDFSVITKDSKPQKNQNIVVSEQSCLLKYHKQLGGLKVAGAVGGIIVAGATVMNPLVMIPGLAATGIAAKKQISLSSKQRLQLVAKIVQDSYLEGASAELEMFHEWVAPHMVGFSHLDLLKQILKSGSESGALCTGNQGDLQSVAIQVIDQTN